MSASVTASPKQNRPVRPLLALHQIDRPQLHRYALEEQGDAHAVGCLRPPEAVERGLVDHFPLPSPAISNRRGVAAFHDDEIDLAGTVPTEGGRLLVFL